MCPDSCDCRHAGSAACHGAGAALPPQQVMKVRRDYNAWVARETLEDHALRFTPRAFRRWSPWRVANTAFGAASFLVLEAVGGTLLVNAGFVNAFWAILATGVVIALCSVPISVCAARYGVDMDLLTRGAGFGYIGSTITSLIYASFTFIFFALEAAIMAYALELAADVPPVIGYLVCALVVLPLVMHGVTAIGHLQAWTQPLWIVLLVLPYLYVFDHEPQLLAGLVRYAGEDGRGSSFDWRLFGGAVTVGIALVTQLGEQADYLRFMPEPAPGRRGRWWAAVLAGGTGWVVLGVFKMLGGALLAYLAISHSVPTDRAVDPNQMYLAAYESVFPRAGWAVAATAVFVVVSQLKINVTNAYAGSLAWSNFFARLTHRHPGRVVWVIFNTAIALMLMELDVFQALGRVLGLYGNVAISWMMAVVADLVVNKPLGWSPPGIEFKRAHLWDVNPVGVGAMGFASLLSTSAYLGAFGPTAQACCALIAAVTAFACAPAIAWITRGRYYLARPGAAHSSALQRCTICEREYEGDDVAACPAYQGPICSLCCSLDARCGDLCKPHARWSAQWNAFLARLLPRAAQPWLATGLGHYLLLMALFAPLAGLLFHMVYRHELDLLGDAASAQSPDLRWSFIKTYAGVLLVGGVAAWWFVLAHKSRQVAQEESNRQTRLLMQEIESHQQTDQQLQAARRQAEAANQAKTRYLSAISHELRTPLNSILGYAQLLEDDVRLMPQRRQAAQVIRRSGDHLLSLIEGSLDIARIEGGKLRLEPRPMNFADALQYAQRMFELQARAKGLRFAFEVTTALPAFVRADEKRLQQILFNLLGNAVKFTPSGEVRLRVSYAFEIARFEIRDTGPGMSATDLDSVFEPFARGSAAQGGREPGSGLGLTIAKMLTELMGGEMRVQSRVGEGTEFRLKLFLPQCGEASAAAHAFDEAPRVMRRSDGAAAQVLVVDNEEADRLLLQQRLAPLGFEVSFAASGEQALARLREGLQPDAILLDLAMPGIDGWQTLRELRRLGLSGTPVAIVSGNAFDRGLENDVGIAPEDFLVKPVARGALLEWLGRRLALERVESSASQPVPAEADFAPDPTALQALREAARMGYPRGVARALERIEADAPGAAFVVQLRSLAGAFRHEEMLTLLDALERSTSEAG